MNRKLPQRSTIPPTYVVGFIFMCTMQDMKFGQTQQVTEDLPLVFFEWCMTEVKNNIAEKYGGNISSY